MFNGSQYNVLDVATFIQTYGEQTVRHERTPRRPSDRWCDESDPWAYVNPTNLYTPHYNAVAIDKDTDYQKH